MKLARVPYLSVILVTKGATGNKIKGRTNLMVVDERNQIYTHGIYCGGFFITSHNITSVWLSKWKAVTIYWKDLRKNYH